MQFTGNSKNVVYVTRNYLHVLKLHFWDHTPQTDSNSHCQHCQQFICRLEDWDWKFCCIMCKPHKTMPIIYCTYSIIVLRNYYQL